MLRSGRLLVVWVVLLVGCADTDQGSNNHAAAGAPAASGAQVVAEAPSVRDSGVAARAPTARDAQMAMPAAAASNPMSPSDAAMAPAAASMPSVPTQSAMEAHPPASSAASPRKVVDNLSDKALAMWGSSVCDGFSVPSGTAWPWAVERRLTEIKGPKVLHVSTSGHNTDSKESALERSKIESADFVVVCLSLGNQGLGSAATDESAQAVVDSYLDDIFTDDSESDGDPASMVNYIKSLGAHPIVTLVYPMADYNTRHCQHVVKANILQQSYGIPVINHLGPTNAGNDFGDGDCTWANALNAPVNVQSDARHPNALGHTEMFYAFPPDLPFAIASDIPFPVRPQTTDYLSLSGPAAAPIRYTPQHAIHNYTMQFGFRAASDGTLAAIDLGMTKYLTIELRAGVVYLVSEGGSDAIHGSASVMDNEWHDVAITYSYVRQKLVLYVDGAWVGEHDARADTVVRELFPQGFVLGGAADSGRPAAPSVLQLRDLFINRTSLHALEIKERAETAWVGAGSLDVYAPLRAAAPAENRAQTLQQIELQL